MALVLLVQRVQLACMAFRRALLHPVSGAWGEVTINVCSLWAPLEQLVDCANDSDVVLSDTSLPHLLALASWLLARHEGPPPLFAPSLYLSYTHAQSRDMMFVVFPPVLIRYLPHIYPRDPVQLNLFCMQALISSTYQSPRTSTLWNLSLATLQL